MQVAVVVVVFLFPLAAQRCATTLLRNIGASMPCPIWANLHSAIMTSLGTLVSPPCLWYCVPSAMSGAV